MIEKHKISQIQDCISILDKSVNEFTRLFNNPVMVKESGISCYRFENTDSLLFQVLKCIRIVSGLNASVVLIETGYVQEVGVLIRTIHEFIHDIEFIQAGHEQSFLNEKQQEMVNLFFSASMKTTDDFLSTMKKNPTVARGKIYPTVARDLSPENPHRIQHTMKAIEETYSGYVHGSYPHVMELYYGGSNSFCLKGMVRTPRTAEWIEYLALCVHPALNVFIGIARYAKLMDTAEELRMMRTKFEESEAYKK